MASSNSRIHEAGRVIFFFLNSFSHRVCTPFYLIFLGEGLFMYLKLVALYSESFSFSSTVITGINQPP